MQHERMRTEAFAAASSSPKKSLEAAGSQLVPEKYRALIHEPNARFIEVVDQRRLPHTIASIRIADANGAADAIRTMVVRGAPLIGAVAAYGLALALDRD